MLTQGESPATLTVKQVAVLLGVAESTVRKMALEKTLPGGLRLRRRVVFSRRQIEAFLAGKPAV
jgi:excisionase family DNA binding protein